MVEILEEGLEMNLLEILYYRKVRTNVTWSLRGTYQRIIWAFISTLAHSGLRGKTESCRANAISTPVGSDKRCTFGHQNFMRFPAMLWNLWPISLWTAYIVSSSDMDFPFLIFSASGKLKIIDYSLLDQDRGAALLSLRDQLACHFVES